MQDIEELCRRVIIIDAGRIIFDGPLEEITNRFATQKILELEFGAPDPRRTPADFGEVIEATDVTVKLRVPRGEVAAVCRRIFDAHDVRDIRVQEVPIEDVIGQLFLSVGREAAPADPVS
jgi:ABC-2 type transport system ATP-binding protein